MTGQQAWRDQLTATERYDNIQKIQEAIESNEKLSSGRTAFAIENEAYASSSSREEYDAACNISQSSEAQDTGSIGSSPPYMHGRDQKKEQQGGEDDDGVADDGIGERIGPYRNCRYVASGITAEVYRCKDRALKVITETHNMAPHDPYREAKILDQLKKPCIPLLGTFRDQEQRFTLVFPYMPLNLSSLLERGSVSDVQVRRIFKDLFHALADIHAKGIIHRDVKPQAILLASPDGPAYLSDFGTAWHPELGVSTEPADAKILDIGTGPYRAPEVLFGDKSYGTAVDMWGAGCMLAECVQRPPKPLFESRAVHEDGNQLGLILSIFKTIGTPTRESWPEAAHFKTPPFDIYRVFEGRPWEEILDGVDDGWRDMVKAMVRYDSGRLRADQLPWNYYESTPYFHMQVFFYIHELLDRELADRKLASRTRLDRSSFGGSQSQASRVLEVLSNAEDLEPLSHFLGPARRLWLPKRVHGRRANRHHSKDGMHLFDGDRSASSARRRRINSSLPSVTTQAPRDAALQGTAGRDCRN